MFGRRRHVAPVAVPPAPQLSEQQVREIVHAHLDSFVGERGEWTLVRRSGADTDSIFHGFIADSVASSITVALMDAKRALEAGTAIEPTPILARSMPAAHIDVPDEALEATIDEPAAFGWEPAPITVWTDLRKPVTASASLDDSRSDESDVHEAHTERRAA